MRAAHFTGLGDPAILGIIDVPARDHRVRARCSCA